MFTKHLLLPLVFIIVLASSCNNEDTSNEDPTLPVRTLSVNEAEITTSANNFTFDLMSEIEKDFPNENYFISPFSISTALSMVLNGSSGTSQEEFIQAIGLDSMTPKEINEAYQSLVAYVYSLDPSITLNISNSNWYSDEYAIDSEFAQTLEQYYDTEIFESDFGAPTTLDNLNGWVENETNGRIKNILNRIDPRSVMFLINTIYFKANWTTQFDSNDTRDLPFTLADGEAVNVPTMSAEVKHWWVYDNALKSQVIEIPYGNENYAFTIIMPDTPSDISDLTSKINADDLKISLADSVTFDRELYLPKFQLDFKTDLINTLINMGMPVTGLDNLFEEELPLSISSVIHQSFLEVNEEGSEAAAATVIGIERTSLPTVTQVNQPFVFLIRERNSGTILFSGKLIDPS